MSWSPSLRGHRVVSMALAMATLAIVTTGCAPTSSGGSDDGAAGEPIVSGSELVTVYDETVANFELTLPAGVTLPKSPPANLGEASGQIGAGKAPAYFFWLCSWEKEYLKRFAANDTKGTKRALDEISSWEQTAYYKRYVEDPDHGWEKDVLDPAKLGDPSGVREDMTASGGCKGLGVSE